MKLSVCITAFDQHELTVAHVRECMRAERKPDEIIVVNDCGDPSLKEMLEKLERTVPIVYARITTDITWNQNGARNLALFLSRGDWIALEDNDHIPSKKFYWQAEKLLLYGYDRVVCQKRFVVSKDDLSKPQEEWKVVNKRGTARIISVNTRELLLDVKGFDEQFSGHYGWDVQDFRFRTAQRGIKETTAGEYYVVGDWMSNIENRRFYPNSTIPKMDSVNYHHTKRNQRNGWTQSEKGILNFQYEITRL